MSEHSLNTSTAEESQIEHEVQIVEPWSPPAGARVPEGSTYFLGDDDGYCRLIRPNGVRCQATRMREIGLCIAHAGRSKVVEDPRGMQAQGAVAKVRARERRELLVRNGINPRSAAREQAIARSDAIVRALVDEPLDDPSMGTRARQRAVLDMLDATFPVTQTTVELELAADPESLSWSDMQRLAAQLLSGDQAT